MFIVVLLGLLIFGVFLSILMPICAFFCTILTDWYASVRAGARLCTIFSAILERVFGIVFARFWQVFRLSCCVFRKNFDTIGLL